MTVPGATRFFKNQNNKEIYIYISKTRYKNIMLTGWQVLNKTVKSIHFLTSQLLSQNIFITMNSEMSRIIFDLMVHKSVALPVFH